MPFQVIMPKLSDAMVEGRVLQWLKKEGDRVAGGDVLASIETDKAEIELEAFGSGVLRKVLADEGQTVPVGQLIAVIAEPDEDIAGLLSAAPAAPAAGAPAAPKVETKAAAPAAPAAVPPAAPPEAGWVPASPIARRMAREAGIDLAQIKGSGPGGRILERDVEAHLATQAQRLAGA
ncbi:MAG: E3 binding domain-containing protein, partial [candidate division NC10 bacterium]|nr:E3 binding domain-containing protein [candidate division NC10 bacterium]